MGARSKLNAMHGYVSVFWAGVVGAAANSWWAFAAALAVLVALNVHAGRIRPSRRAGF